MYFFIALLMMAGHFPITNHLLSHRVWKTSLPAFISPTNNIRSTYNTRSHELEIWKAYCNKLLINSLWNNKKYKERPKMSLKSFYFKLSPFWVVNDSKWPPTWKQEMVNCVSLLTSVQTIPLIYLLQCFPVYLL